MNSQHRNDGNRPWVPAGAAAFTAGTARLREADTAPAEIYATLRRQSPYLPGMAITDGRRKGVLLDLAEPEPRAYLYRVWFIGADAPEQLTPNAITIADSPPIELSTHEVRTLGRAMEELAQRQADFEHAKTASEPVNYHVDLDRELLIAGLTSWNGAPEQQLLAQLRTRIGQHLAALRESATAPQLVAGDFAGTHPPALHEQPPVAAPPTQPQPGGPGRADAREARRTR